MKSKMIVMIITLIQRIKIFCVMYCDKGPLQDSTILTDTFEILLTVVI